MKAKTPFQIDDVYQGYVSIRTAGDTKILIRQWIVRRDIVADILSRLGLTPDGISFLTRGDEQASTARIPVRPTRDAANSSRVQKVAWTLIVSMALLAAASAASTCWRQQSQLDRLALEVASSRSKAQKVRSEFDKLEKRQGALVHLRQQRIAKPTLLEILDEATRVLPSHSWLTELHISERSPKQEQQVTMTGLSAAASTLVGLVVQSPIFFDASLTAPISIDPVEGRERFVLQAKVRPSKRDVKPP